MLSIRVTELVAAHADELADRIVADIQSNPKTAYYHVMDVSELRRRIRQLFGNLNQWLVEIPESELRNTYVKFGQVRFWEEVPLPDLVYAIILTRQHLIEFIRHHSTADSSLHIYQEMEVHDLISRFYDEIIYFTITGYRQAMEDAGRERRS